MPIPIAKQRRQLKTTKVVTQEDLVRDSVLLGGLIAQKWPHVDAIAGVPRSGMIPASIIATMLSIPLYELHQGELNRLGGGKRSRRMSSECSSIVVVEDSINTGYSLDLAYGSSPHPNLIGRCAVYSTLTHAHKADLYAVALPLPHFFTWHMFGSNILCREVVGCDMDGILCRDCPRECDDDGVKYLTWMDEVVPLYPYRGGSLSFIVTARLEKYRTQTESWLQKYKIGYRHLIMGPWQSKQERSKDSVSRWKAEQVNKHKMAMFVESDPKQSESISKLSKVPVLCPEARKVFVR